MSDTPNPNNPPEHKITPTERRNLKEAFEAMDKGTSEPGEFLEAVREALGLPEGTDTKAALLKHFPGSDAEKVVQRELAKERDDARAELTKVKGERDAEKVNAALRSAFEKSGAGREHEEDFLALARPLFTVDAKTGAVVTRADAPNTVAGQNAEAWIVSELRAKRGFWWPMSQGGASRGAGFLPSGGADDSMFNPRSPNYNFTAQLAAEARFGPAFADRARQRYGRGGAR